ELQTSTTMSIPDEHIYPRATGLAAKTVEQHQEPQDLWMGSSFSFSINDLHKGNLPHSITQFCPFVQRSWICLKEKGIPYQYVEVNPYKKERHFLDINPKGLVPAIEYKGKALYESLVICEFLEDAYPEHTPALLPADPYERAVVRLWADFANKSIVPAVFRTIIAQDSEKQRTNLAELADATRAFAAKVKGPYFLGEQFSLVDVAVAPFVVRDYILARHRGYSREAIGGGWAAYAENLERRDSVLRTSSDKHHYEEIYGRYLRDEAQSEAARALRSGEILP
ncbi:Glutathione S-transferase omega-1, partial [Grifola frondosa]